MASKVDRRSLLGDEEKEEVKEPAPAEEAVEEEPPKVEKIKPLGMDFVRIIAEQWPKSMQGQSMMDRLPTGLGEMLDEQTDEFVLGFANGIQAVHDLGVKVLLDELRGRLIQRNQGNVGAMSLEHLLTPQDRLITMVATLVEGVGYLACKSLNDRTSDQQEQTDGQEESSN